MKKHFKLMAGILLTLILCVTVLMGVKPTTAAAADNETTFDWLYQDGTFTVRRYTGSAENVEIPSSVGGVPVVAIANDAFISREHVKSIKIPNSVTSIGANAFLQCTNLKSITIPSSVTSMGGSTFFGCTNLETVKFEGGLTTIAFYTFKDCPKLKSVTIPESVTTIEEYAFSGCDSLSSITIPKSVTKMYATSFTDCPALTKIEVASGNTKYCSVNGVLFDKDKTTLMRYPAGKKSDSYTTPDSVKYISKDAFSKSSYLKKVTIKGTVTRIDYRVFEYCTALTSVTFPDSLKYIDANAFRGCSSMTSLHLPVNVEDIDAKGFQGCDKLAKITVDSSNQHIVSVGNVLYNKEKTYLMYYPAAKTDTKYVIPEGVTSIQAYAFYNCAKLKEITIPSTIRWFNKETFFKVGTVGVGKKATPLKINNNSKFAITYSVKNTDFATVDSSGAATGKKVGKTEIYSNDEILKIELHVEFNDVTSPSAYYYDPVYWAANHQITEGVKSSKTGLYDNFAPLSNCTRGQMVTFLWRMADCPEPVTKTSPFTDVKDTKKYYYKAVLWGSENGIVNGYSDHTFRPESTCTRQQAVTFIWRLADEPNPSSMTSPFPDVKDKNTYYYKAVLWAAENGITEGYPDGNFKPTNLCTRGQIVTFLYRWVASNCGYYPD